MGNTTREEVQRWTELGARPRVWYEVRGHYRSYRRYRNWLGVTIVTGAWDEQDPNISLLSVLCLTPYFVHSESSKSLDFSYIPQLSFSLSNSTQSTCLLSHFVCSTSCTGFNSGACYYISKDALVLQTIIGTYKGPLPNHFDPCKPL